MEESVLSLQSLGSEEPAQTCSTFSSKKSFVSPELFIQVPSVGELRIFSHHSYMVSAWSIVYCEF